jgi:predicted membrane protein
MAYCLQWRVRDFSRSTNRKLTFADLVMIWALEGGWLERLSSFRILALNKAEPESLREFSMHE